MRVIAKYFFAILLLCGAFHSTSAQSAEPPPLSVYGDLPEVETVALSPSGNRLATVMTVNGQRVLLMLTSELDQLQTMPLLNEKIRSMEWIGDDRLALVFSQTKTLGPEFVTSQFEFFHAVILSASNGEERRVVFDKDVTMLNAVFGTYGTRNVDGKWIAYFGGVERTRGARDYVMESGAPALFAVDVEKHDWRRIADRGGDGESRRWLLGPNGSVAATFSIQSRDGRWSIKAPGGVTLASGVAKQGNVGLTALGQNGDTVIYSEENPDDRIYRLFEVPLDGSKKPHEFARADEFQRLFTDRATGRLLGFLPTGAEQRPKFYAPEHQAAVNGIYKAFPGLHVDLMDWTPGLSRVLLRTSGNGDSGTWYLVDLAQKKATAIGYERIAVGPEQVGPISKVDYKAGDGMDLDGILTLPPGREAKNLPIVLLPHGGPHSHDEKVFDWWAQAFASRGYAVFQPNFRGSTNRDEAFMEAGFGQWGRTMQSDISDGIAELAKQGIVDPKRACIVGASYGGYAALAGVTLQQGIYRCAVAVAPVTDLSSLFSDEMKDGGQAGMLKRSLIEELGPRSGFDEVSPRRFAARADAPILLIHGKDDTVVPFDQSTKMVNALKDAHKPYEFLEMKEEDHWLSRAATRKQMLDAAVTFVQKHNPAD